MTSLLQAEDRSGGLSKEETQTPPHGFKDDLGQAPLVTPASILVLSGVILLVAVAVSFGFWLVRLWRARFSNKVGSDGAVDQVTEWAKLKVDIEKIQEPSGPSVEFASDVSLCLRRAIEIKTDLPLAERTTDEILGILNKEVIQGLSKEDVMGLLLRLDEVRFAEASLESGEARAIIEQLKSSVIKLEEAGHSAVTANLNGRSQLNEKGQIFD
jgi:hypothetical protein